MIIYRETLSDSLLISFTISGFFGLGFTSIVLLSGLSSSISVFSAFLVFSTFFWVGFFFWLTNIESSLKLLINSSQL